MKAIYKLNANEVDTNLIDAIKDFFKTIPGFNDFMNSIRKAQHRLGHKIDSSDTFIGKLIENINKGAPVLQGAIDRYTQSKQENKVNLLSMLNQYITSTGGDKALVQKIRISLIQKSALALATGNQTEADFAAKFGAHCTALGLDTKEVFAAAKATLEIDKIIQTLTAKDLNKAKAQLTQQNKKDLDFQFNLRGAGPSLDELILTKLARDIFSAESKTSQFILPRDNARLKEILLKNKETLELLATSLGIYITDLGIRMVTETAEKPIDINTIAATL